ncbi:hypothetical protein M427DRAFT_149601 [Gonapodya prolifera JEL478]|uniref:Abnormal spindle-like microcephaly-associated protein ASH domain-containing protein n=1 Tax=Gonapodya prolifera (strain JEL478) TaxID=1344416 RepID=A0A138ZYR9_GONPJ|nr:hypothetical protein M427DRAFT_149601 [Gonapodya prolifera JEL478]|eukprot:KXS09649.1 hypothetical protein M427DRAFT_149601 [Gonapodya prolifera JEL478]
MNGARKRVGDAGGRGGRTRDTTATPTAAKLATAAAAQRQRPQSVHAQTVGRDLWDEQRRRDADAHREERHSALHSFFSVRAHPNEIEFADVDVAPARSLSRPHSASHSLSRIDDDLDSPSAPLHIQTLTLSNFSRRSVKLCPIPPPNPHFALRDPSDTSLPAPSSLSLAPGASARIAVAFSLDVLAPRRPARAVPLGSRPDSATASAYSVASPGRSLATSLGHLGPRDPTLQSIQGIHTAQGLIPSSSSSLFRSVLSIDILSPPGRIDVPLRASIASPDVSLPPFLDMGTVLRGTTLEACLVLTNLGGRDALCHVVCEAGGRDAKCTVVGRNVDGGAGAASATGWSVDAGAGTASTNGSTPQRDVDTGPDVNADADPPSVTILHPSITVPARLRLPPPRDRDDLQMKTKTKQHTNAMKQKSKRPISPVPLLPPIPRARTPATPSSPTTPATSTTPSSPATPATLDTSGRALLPITASTSRTGSFEATLRVRVGEGESNGGEGEGDETQTRAVIVRWHVVAHAVEFLCGDPTNPTNPPHTHTPITLPLVLQSDTHVLSATLRNVLSRPVRFRIAPQGDQDDVRAANVVPVSGALPAGGAVGSRARAGAGAGSKGEGGETTPPHSHDGHWLRFVPSEGTLDPGASLPLAVSFCPPLGVTSPGATPEGTSGGDIVEHEGTWGIVSTLVAEPGKETGPGAHNKPPNVLHARFMGTSAPVRVVLDPPSMRFPATHVSTSPSTSFGPAPSNTASITVCNASAGPVRVVVDRPRAPFVIVRSAVGGAWEGRLGAGEEAVVEVGVIGREAGSYSSPLVVKVLSSTSAHAVLAHLSCHLRVVVHPRQPPSTAAPQGTCPPTRGERQEEWDDKKVHEQRYIDWYRRAAAERGDGPDGSSDGEEEGWPYLSLALPHEVDVVGAKVVEDKKQPSKLSPWTVTPLIARARSGEVQVPRLGRRVQGSRPFVPDEWPLVPESLLNSIFVGVAELDMGEVEVGARAVRGLNFLNAGGETVWVQVLPPGNKIMAGGREQIKKVECNVAIVPVRGLELPAGEVGGVEISVVGRALGIWKAKLVYVINGKHKYSLPISANVKLPSLLIQPTLLQMQATVSDGPTAQEGWPSTWGALTLTNAGIAPVKFSFSIDPTAVDGEGKFEATSLGGRIESGGSFVLAVKFTPGLRPLTDKKARINIVDDEDRPIGGGTEVILRGETPAVRLVWAGASQSFGLHTVHKKNAINAVDFGVVPVFNATTENVLDMRRLFTFLATSRQRIAGTLLGNVAVTLVLKNASLTDAAFSTNTNKCSGDVFVYPGTSTVTRETDKEVIIAVTPSMPGVFQDDIVVLAAGGGKPIHVPLQYEAKVPVVEVTGLCSLGAIVVGGSRTGDFSISNTSAVLTKCAIDLRLHGEFQIVAGALINAQNKKSSINASMSVIDSSMDVWHFDGIQQSSAKGPYGCLYLFDVLPGQTLKLQLHYQPQNIGCNDFYLTIDVVGCGTKRILVHAEGIESPLVVSQTQVCFGNQNLLAATKDARMPATEIVNLFNISETDTVSWWIGNAELLPDAFRLEPTWGQIAPQEKSQIIVTFTPQHPSYYSFQAEMFLQDIEGSTGLFISGVAITPSLIFDPPELILPTVPLESVSEATIKVTNHTGESCDLQFDIERSVQQITQIQLSFPDGKITSVVLQFFLGGSTFTAI